MTKIKICGIRRIEDALYLNECIPDYAGFILSKPFWRCISYEQLGEICKTLSKDIKRVGVFVNEEIDYILKYASLLDVIQLHGDENSDYISKLSDRTDCEIWKAVRVKTSDDIEEACDTLADKVLIDSFSKTTYGGSGKVANWDLIRNAKITKPFFLAGGISIDNCIDAIGKLKPFGIDVSSSVETDKLKDKNKIIELITKIRNINSLYERG